MHTNVVGCGGAASRQDSVAPQDRTGSKWAPGSIEAAEEALERQLQSERGYWPEGAAGTAGGQWRDREVQR